MALTAQSQTLGDSHRENREKRHVTSDGWAEDITKDIRGTRYHEAGHAVTDQGGRTEYLHPEPDGWANGWADAWREACITMAGPLAGQRAVWGEMRPESWDEFLWEAEERLQLIESGFDWLRGTDHCELLPLLYQMGDDPEMGAEPEESYRIVVEHSGQLVTRLWAEIEAVARALEEYNTLDGTEVVRIIEQTTRGRYDLASLKSRLSV